MDDIFVLGFIKPVEKTEMIENLGFQFQETFDDDGNELKTTSGNQAKYDSGSPGGSPAQELNIDIPENTF